MYQPFLIRVAICYLILGYDRVYGNKQKTSGICQSRYILGALPTWFDINRVDGVTVFSQLCKIPALPPLIWGAVMFYLLAVRTGFRLSCTWYNVLVSHEKWLSWRFTLILNPHPPPVILMNCKWWRRLFWNCSYTINNFRKQESLPTKLCLYPSN